MIRLFFGGAGLGLCVKLFIKSDDFMSQTIALLFMPIFFLYLKAAIDNMTKEDE